MYLHGDSCCSTVAIGCEGRKHCRCDELFDVQHDSLLHMRTRWLIYPVQVGGPEPPKSRERHDDFYANVGDAIRTLRDDVPTLFKSDINCARFLPPYSSLSSQNCSWHSCIVRLRLSSPQLAGFTTCTLCIQVACNEHLLLPNSFYICC
jgi:hypothetical protein